MENLNLNFENIKTFFLERPALSINQVEKDAGIPNSTLAKFVAGKRGLPKKYLEMILPTMEKYGFKQ